LVPISAFGYGNNVTTFLGKCQLEIRQKEKEDKLSRKAKRGMEFFSTMC
jgi:hypothetical protein